MLCKPSYTVERVRARGVVVWWQELKHKFESEGERSKFPGKWALTDWDYHDRQAKLEFWLRDLVGRHTLENAIIRRFFGL